MPRKKKDLIKEAADKAAEGYKLLGLDPEGKPLEAAPGATTDQLQQATPGEEGQPAPSGTDKTDKQDADKDEAIKETAAPDKPASAPDVEQLQKNYDHLRSYADRVSGENASLKKEMADLRSQIQILLSVQPPDQGQPQAKGADASQHGAGGEHTGDVGTQAQTSTQAETLQQKKERLRALADEFPEIGGVILEYIDALEQTTQTRITQVEQTLHSQVKPVVDTFVEDTRRRALEEAERKKKEHADAIAKAIPNWQSLVFDGDRTDESGRRYLNPAFDNFLLSHPAGDDYFRMLFPDEPGKGASAGMVIQILQEFAKSDYSKGLTQTIAEKRNNDAAGDLQNDRKPKPLVPDTGPKSAVDKLKAGMPVTQADIQEVMKLCRGDSQKWAELWPLVQKAQEEKRIVVEWGNPALYT